MPIICAPQELVDSDVYVDLRPLVHRDVYLKCEGFNFGWSVKMRAAAAMVAAAERDGSLQPDSILVESSSGNLGVALSMVAASKGLEFTCVTDPRCSQSSLRVMKALGATVIVIDQPHPDGGLLAARKAYVRELCRANPHFLWLNQYENPANWVAHYEGTAAAIAKDFPELDVLFVGTGTGGTLMGCARFFRDTASGVRVVAVDSLGSANFGGDAMPRLIPGLGSTVPAPALDLSIVDDSIYVSEEQSIRTCRALSARGFFFGGSTGTVVTGAMSWLSHHDPRRLLRSVAISPDLGDRYLDTVYDDDWVLAHFGRQALRPVAW